VRSRARRKAFGMPPILITPAELVALRSERPVHVLDVRWRLDRPDGRPEYLAGHLPGAVYVDLDTELAQHGAPEDGRHPLPPEEALKASARRWGLRTGETVVVYDDLKNLSAARAWWLLRFAGVADVRLLDGSLRAWTAAGLPLEEGDVRPEEGDVELAYGALPTLDIDAAARFPDQGVLLDARAEERYRGEVEPVDPRAGHIPGAVNAPTTGNVGPDGRFLSRDALRARFAALGVVDAVPVAAYCGSGVTAAHEAVALTLAGFAPVLYPGSWSQWSNHPTRPVATGDTRIESEQPA
jgi:thiosulfate/3-mercaptopyruvate sulfurtransferase